MTGITIHAKHKTVSNPRPQVAGSLGGIQRAQNLTEEERSLIASKAAVARWYSPSRNVDTRINAILRGLAAAAERALDQGNEDRYIRAVSAMAPWERMRLWVDRDAAGKAQPIPMELQEEGNEAMRKFQEGQKQSEIEATAEKVEEKK